MKKVFMTGSSGVIGKVLRDGLSSRITGYDLPDGDVRQYEQLVEAMRGHDVVVHLAWDTKSDNYLSDFHHPENALQAFNIYRAAIAAGVPRVIVASSVHADKFTGRKIDELFNPYALPTPDSPYGAGKVFMESLGRYYADSKGLEVVCVRFGGVNPDDSIPVTPYSEGQVWLSHRDCSALLQKSIDVTAIENHYAIVYAVSDNPDRLHDITNPFDWYPQDGSREH